MISTTNELPFELRLKMASAVIDAQVQRAKPTHQQSLLNGLWARWINDYALHNKAAAREVKPQ